MGAGERGVEKGCAALVEVAAGGLEGDKLGAEVESVWVKEGRMRNAEARWRQRWQIMACVIENIVSQ